MVKYFLLAVGFIACSSAIAHTDTIIEINANGSLIGLPRQYSPAFLDTNNWVLSIKDKQFKFPKCLSDSFTETDVSEILLSSSWYHEGRGGFNMPNYLNIEIKSAKFSRLFSLETAQPFIVQSHEDLVTFSELTKDEICEET